MQIFDRNVEGMNKLFLVAEEEARNDCMKPLHIYVPKSDDETYVLTTTEPQQEDVADGTGRHMIVGSMLYDYDENGDYIMPHPDDLHEYKNSILH